MGRSNVGLRGYFRLFEHWRARERAFFDLVRRRSVLTACERCERPVQRVPPKALCASCISALEYGAPASMKKYGPQKRFWTLLTNDGERQAARPLAFASGLASGRKSSSSSQKNKGVDLPLRFSSTGI